MTNRSGDERQKTQTSSRIRWQIPIAWIAAWVLSAAFQTLAGASQQDLVFDSPRPLWELAEWLQSHYAIPVTLEEPLWAGVSSDGRPLAFYALTRNIRLVVPADLLPDDPSRFDLALLKQIVALFNREGADPIQFDAVSSEWGLHIVPVALRKESGEIMRISSPLDLAVHVETRRRMASEHFRALCEGLSALAGGEVRPFAPSLDGWFAAGGLVPPKWAAIKLSEKEREPFMFPWGVEKATGRSALIDLLKLSSTTLSWKLLCRDNRGMFGHCTLNLTLLSILERDEQGRPVLNEDGKPRLRFRFHDRLSKVPLKVPPIQIR